MYTKTVIEGKLIRETKTHYITKIPNGTASWHKAWYRLMTYFSS